MPPPLRRTLSLRDLIVYGLLFIGPLAPVGVYGVLVARAHGAVALVYLLATLAMGFTAWSYAEMSRVVPHAGSVFAYATAGIGPRAGFLAGWLAMLDYLLIPSVAYLFCGIAMHALVPSIPSWIFTVVAFVVTTALNATGVGVAARAGSIVLMGELAIFVVFVVAAVMVLAGRGAARPWIEPLAGQGAFDAGAVAGAVSVAVLSFLGFDAIASFAEETTGDARQVGRAIRVCLVLAGGFFLVQTYLAGLLGGWSIDDLTRAPERQGTLFYDVTRTAIGPWLATMTATAKAIGPAFAAMTAQAASARLLFGMARDGNLPAALARVDEQHGVPRTALFAAATLTLAVSVWAARRSDGLDILVSLVDVGALAAFVLLHVSVIGYFRRARPRIGGLRHGVVPVLGIAVTGWVIFSASPAAKAVGAGWLALGLMVGTARRASRDPTGPAVV